MNFGDFLDTNSCGGESARIGGVDLGYTANAAANNNPNTIGAPASGGDLNTSSIMPTTAISHQSQQRLLPHHSLASKPIFHSPGLSLALQTGMEGQGEMGRMGDQNNNYEMMSNIGGRRSRDEEHESRSGSDNMDGGGSGDDQDAADNDKPPRKKRYHRHTPQQIQELEAYDAHAVF